MEPSIYLHVSPDAAAPFAPKVPFFIFAGLASYLNGRTSTPLYTFESPLEESAVARVIASGFAIIFNIKLGATPPVAHGVCATEQSVLATIAGQHY